jgi:hypothetical protein
MSQIEITVLKQGKVSRNVLTCCLFTTGDLYRVFNQYVGDFKRFLTQTEHLKTFEVRVYTDDTAKDIVLEAAGDNPRVTVLHFNCPQFREGTGHVGMFGTLVRFLPMFEDLDTVWCSDIDIPSRYLDDKLYDHVIHKKVDFMISTFICYERKVWGTKNTILAGRFISRIQFPRRLLTLFLNRISDGKLSEKIEEINTANTRKPRSNFPYGMDEYFLNTYVYNWLKAHNSRILVQKEYLDFGILFRMNNQENKRLLLDYYYRPSYSVFLKIKKILLKYVPEFLADHPCYEELLVVLPKLKDSFIVFKLFDGSEL